MSSVVQSDPVLSRAGQEDPVLSRAGQDKSGLFRTGLGTDSHCVHYQMPFLPIIAFSLERKAALP